MSGLPIIVLLLCMLTLLVMIAGVVCMATGGKMNEKYGNSLMIARVSLQGLTVLALFALAT